MWIDSLGPVKTSQTSGLNWNGAGDRQAHVIDNHGSINPNKSKQSIFKQKPVPTVNKAWKKRMNKNRCPDSSDNDTDTYNIEMNQPIGYNRDTGAILTKVKIIVLKALIRLLQETQYDKI